MNNHPEYTTINWKTAPSIKPRSHNTKYKVSSVFTNLSLSIFLRCRVNDTAFYHTSQTTISYVRCPMNINGTAFQGISSAHSQVGESDGVRLLHESRWSTLDEFRLWSQVSKGRLCVFESAKGWGSSLNAEAVASGLAGLGSCPLDIRLPLCVHNNSNPRREQIVECRNKPNIVDFKSCFPGRTCICIAVPQWTK